MKNLNGMKSILKDPFAWILAIGFLLRFYSALTRGIINPDGILYIYEAKTIFYREWHRIVGCDLEYLSLFPFLIAAAYTITRHWVAAGLLVNILSGTGVLVPLYFILKRFLDRPLTLATVLIFALMPAFVSGSADILKDPPFWLLLCAGMLLFVRQWDSQARHRRYRFDLIFSSICFLLAGWTRIEGVAIIGGSALFLLISKSDRKFERLFLFLSPVIVAGLMVFPLALILGKSVGAMLRIESIYAEVTNIAYKYNELRKSLGAVASQYNGSTAEFLKLARHIAWLMPAVIIFNEILDGLFFIFALIFFSGFIGLGRRIKEDPRVGYFCCLTMVGFLVLYFHLLEVWLVFHRFLAIIIFPGCLFFGFGLKHIFDFLQARFSMGPKKALAVLGVFFLLLTIPKDLRQKEEDKIIYRQAAEVISRDKPDQQIARIAAMPGRAYSWIFFYANLDFPGALCGRDLIFEVPDSYDLFISALKKEDINYVVYEEQSWPNNKFDLLAAPYQHDLRPVGKWFTDKHQELILFERF